ncbi:hypothetical protein GCK32_014058, partial [Trichostrongylus colubriformis]
MLVLVHYSLLDYCFSSAAGMITVASVILMCKKRKGGGRLRAGTSKKRPARKSFALSKTQSRPLSKTQTCS